MTAPIVTIFGGSGFVGRHIARRMAQRGWRVRVAVRRPNEAVFVRPYGNVGQVEPIQANIRDEESTRRAIEGATAVINCVGIMYQDGYQKFDAVQNEGAARVARLASDCGVERLVHFSALGADADSDSAYARSKAEGEAGVTEVFASAVILRPSVVFGSEDQLFNKFAGMARLSPVLPLVGANTKFQPVYVDDVAEAACRVAEGQAEVKVYELGGQSVYSLREMNKMMLAETRRRRLVVNMPFFVGGLLAFGLDLLQSCTVGLVANRILTRDQVKMLRSDNVVSGDAAGLEDLGITATSAESVLGEYLYAFRPYGQYDAITESAGRLKA